jgi:hypothetical protein
MDIKNKESLCATFGIDCATMVTPFEPISIIEIPGLGSMCAVDLCIKGAYVCVCMCVCVDEIVCVCAVDLCIKGVYVCVRVDE